jgi:hypothetical protein
MPPNRPGKYLRRKNCLYLIHGKTYWKKNIYIHTHRNTNTPTFKRRIERKFMIFCRFVEKHHNVSSTTCLCSRNPRHVLKTSNGPIKNKRMVCTQIQRWYFSSFSRSRKLQWDTNHQFKKKDKLLIFLSLIHYNLCTYIQSFLEICDEINVPLTSLPPFL